MNELIEHKGWFKLNWKWFVPLIISLIAIIGFLSSTKVSEKIAGMVKIHTESSVYDNALEIAKQNEKVIELLGELQPLGKLAILEGFHEYSRDYNTLEISVTVTGTKTEKQIRSKMDILADRNGNEWIYKTINIRIKKPAELKQTIEIIRIAQ
ncbi:cytochrome c oxidase assembly factor Coa1 family protein [Maribacter sp. R77961]|uniref:cytochrome c oxidase assembly factor Coa1 family protein n=1 Tax=Maribacter sp. R77961 TaxID=3093871 RepID=UPI0037C7B4D7